MAAKRTASGGTDRRRGARRTAAEAPAPGEARRPDEERRFVDVDPWAVLLERLTEPPEESAPAGREAGKGE